MRKNKRTDNDIKRTRRVQELRSSSASEAIPSGARYNRSKDRKHMQRQNWDKVEN